MIMLGYAFSWVFAYIGMVSSTPEAANAIGFMAIFPLTFISSAFVPVESMPAALQAFAEVNPFTTCGGRDAPPLAGRAGEHGRLGRVPVDDRDHDRVLLHLDGEVPAHRRQVAAGLASPDGEGRLARRPRPRWSSAGSSRSRSARRSRRPCSTRSGRAARCSCASSSPRSSCWRSGARRCAFRPARRDGRGALGVVLAAMNLSFYLALDRIPLGIAVTLEFVGPLAVAVVGSRRRLDLLWVALAAAGCCSSPPSRARTWTRSACAFALFAGACWARYILLTARVGRALPGGGGLAIAMAIAALAVTSVRAGRRRRRPARRGAARDRRCGVAILSSAIPYSFELEALRRLPQATFGVLMSLEPAVAATVGFVVLGQDLAAREVVAIGLVLAASAGALSAAAHARRPSGAAERLGALGAARSPRHRAPVGAGSAGRRRRSSSARTARRRSRACCG